MTNGSIVLQWTPPSANARRIVLEPRAAGGWDRIEQRWNGDKWVTVGQEIVADVQLDAPAAAVHDDSPILG